jgi:fatty acid desaturase
MQQNVGTADMVARIVVGVILLAFAVVAPAANWWGWIGLIPLATGVARWCPVYKLLHTDTCGGSKSEG